VEHVDAALGGLSALWHAEEQCIWRKHQGKGMHLACCAACKCVCPLHALCSCMPPPPHTHTNNNHTTTARQIIHNLNVHAMHMQGSVAFRTNPGAFLGKYKMEFWVYVGVAGWEGTAAKVPDIKVSIRGSKA
jgi:hypothetical protein